MSGLNEEYDEKKYGDQYSTQVGSAQDGSAQDAHAPETAYGEGEVKVGLKRQLKARHMAMISIGGVIGTGEREISTEADPHVSDSR